MAYVYMNQTHSGVFRERIQCEQGETLYEVLVRHGIPIPGAVCKGAGVCRGCQVYIVEEGMECLACHYQIASEELHIVLQGTLAKQSILLTNQIQDTSEVALYQNASLGIAFDIGTTTIASALVDLASGQILSQAGCMNRQATYGADVISRIQYATDSDMQSIKQTSGLETMHQLIKSDIEGLMQHYMEEGYHKGQIRRLTVSGNTTMIHFLLKLSVDGMTGYPFTPEKLTGERFMYNSMEVIILPGKSAFVGADIVSGIRYLELGTHEEYDLLIDLGTNGELWLLNRDGGVCTSTSCGPAFANSVTKGNVYGTSLLDVLARAYREGNVDATGLLQGEYFEKGITMEEVVITQDTVRQIQLAKAAILTGIELCAYELRLPLDTIKNVYLAGGFGFYLNLETAYTLGMLPEEFRDRIHIAGNTSLHGSIRALLHPDDMLKLPDALERSQVLDLSMNKNFQEFFLHRIGFPN